MVTDLLDGNVLIALGDSDHVHHAAATKWFGRRDGAEFATCPITQGTLLRLLLRHRIATDIGQAVRILRGFMAHPGHRLWADDLSYDAIRWDGVLGHGQVTDAYLAALARKHGGRLATLDRGLAALHDDVAELIPS
ncbi:MAG: TA system VapC family ribonuclease toxin [Dokdonella sp.]